MRCKRCRVEIESGSLCDACAEGSASSSQSFLNQPVSNTTALLVILGVVCLLAPAIGPCNRRERAVQSKSLNNIKQLAIGVMTYSQDYQETFPGWVRNPDGEYAHNCWDELINPSTKSKDVYCNGDTGIRSYSDPTRQRVLTYGLNGLLITPAKASFDGNADFGAVNAKKPPKPLRPGAMGNPAGTILFAELATDAPMLGVYGQEPNPKPYTYTDGNASKQWQDALTGWIDISPRAFVEVMYPAVGSYDEPWAGHKMNGIARDLYKDGLSGGGGCYAFCDGHVRFMKIGKSVGIGTVVKGKTVTESNCWEPWNTNNMWNPG
jgi:prepilin-type processing-associated H-X9-DG protein